MACVPTARSHPGAPSSAGLLARRYVDGDTLRYKIAASHAGPNGIKRYAAIAESVVGRDSANHSVEAVNWTSLTLNDSTVALAVRTSRALQQVSLDTAVMPAIPKLQSADPGLVGPMLDLMTFYVDLQLAAKQQNLTGAGDRRYVPVNVPASWSDGKRVLVGEDAVDFDIMIEKINRSTGEAVVRVRHVPPPSPSIHVRARWMTDSSGLPHRNWMEVTKVRDRYVASIGAESFDVSLVVNLTDGRILSATMFNPIDIVERTCGDVVLEQCGPERRYRIVRTVDMHIASP